MRTNSLSPATELCKVRERGVRSNGIKLQCKCEPVDIDRDDLDEPTAAHSYLAPFSPPSQAIDFREFVINVQIYAVRTLPFMIACPEKKKGMLVALTTSDYS